MLVRPFLIYSGQCNEAIALYSRAFNTRAAQVMRFSDLPADPDHPLPAEKKDWVLMAVMPIGEVFIRLSDTMGGLNEAETDRLGVSFEASCDEVRHAFAVLAEEGRVSHPLGATFFSPCFGNLHDKFGVLWQLVGQADEEDQG